MEGLLLAHDRVATTADRSPAVNIYAPSAMEGVDVVTSQSISQNIANNNILRVRKIS